MIEALDIQVKGIVQGVGFRPFVYRLAKKYLVNGWVLNATDGVFIHAEAEAKLLDEFVIELSENPPAASQVDEITLKEVPLEDFDTFEIRFSDAGAVEKTTLVSPDLATCDDCARELFNPNDRRYRYPFINCTNCGPRFTIIEKLPYDRKSTSMKDFPMCERCAHEYGDPLDRRFHAQPDACFECGPHISWREHEGGDIEASLAPASWGSTREESDAIFTRAVEVLLAGGILAVKGLGGFHLVCDAENPEALAKLRARKRREGKAFAVMMADAEAVRRVCSVDEIERSVLETSQRPIVLLRKLPGAAFAPGLADRLPELGVMLPYTPVQHLLLHDFIAAGGGGMLVMTSGNIHDEPIVIDDEDAYEKLAGVADAFLGHNRAIRARYDDSVVRVIAAGSAGEAVQFVRRARGYAPLPLALPVACHPDRAEQPPCHPERAEQPACHPERPKGVEGSRAAPAGALLADAKRDPSTTALRASAQDDRDRSCASAQDDRASIFATGPEQKNTFALTRDAEAFVSQHIGDMENAETYDAWLDAKNRYETLFEIKPALVACDLHPEYLTSKWAHEQELPVAEVQHHHAHVVSVMGEHGLSGPACGIAFDGTGYGADGAIWGGEVLVSNLRAYERFANFAYVPMPGGAACVKHPQRMAYGALWAFDLLEHPAAADTLAALGEQADVCEQMIDRGLNTPMTSSVGRLFDAASALLGVCVEPTYEGEPAILLEAAMASDACCYPERPQPSPCHPERAQRVEGSSAPPDPSTPALRASARDDGSSRYAMDVVKNTATAESTAQDTSVVLFDAAPTFKALLDDKAAGVPVPVVARRFHDAFVQAVVMAAELVRTMYGIETVALSGGVFMNRYLVEHALAALENVGFTVAVNRDLPPNDGCISFGQAVVAWASNEEGAAEGGA